jgi:hypothetical protein
MRPTRTDIRSFARMVAREPLVHFALLGAALFAVYALVGHRGQRGAGEASVLPISRRIDIDRALLERLGEGFRRAWKREPTREELAEMVLDHVNEEMLYREAQRLRLDRDDPAVRRRMIEKVTVMKQPQAPVPEPSEAELRRWFDQHPHHFHEPDRFWFRQLFFDPQRRRASLNEDAAKVLAELRRDGDGDRLPPAATGDVSSLPPVVEAMPALQVAHLFGKGFLGSLAGAPVGRWEGPLSSTQGLHLVRLERRQMARDPAFAEVQAAVRADWITARSKGTLEAAGQLLPQYQIHIAPDSRQQLTGASLLAPVLEAAR